MIMKKEIIFSLAVFVLMFLLCMISACSNDSSNYGDTISSRSYSGHESDRDANNFVRFLMVQQVPVLIIVRLVIGEVLSLIKTLMEQQGKLNQ